jgi:hypothetical protein
MTAPGSKRLGGPLAKRRATSICAADSTGNIWSCLVSRTLNAASFGTPGRAPSIPKPYHLTLRRARSARLEGRQHHDCIPPFETHRFAALLRVRWFWGNGTWL